MRLAWLLGWGEGGCGGSGERNKSVTLFLYFLYFLLGLTACLVSTFEIELIRRLKGTWDF